MVCQLNITNEKNYPLAGLETKLDKVTQLVEANTDLDENKNWVFNLFLIDEKESQWLNKQYRQKDYPADVLAFPFYYLYQKELDDCNELGDIFLCYALAQKQSQEYQHSFDYEFCFLFTHGMLHLLGYDHETPKEKKIMFDLQDLILNEVDLLI